MDLSVHEDMLSNVPLSVKFERARDAGFDGIDLRGDLLTRRVDVIRRLSEQTGIRTSSIYSRLGISLVSRNIDIRREAMSILRHRIRDTHQVGATKLIVVPIFGAPQITVQRENGIRDIELSLLLVLLDELSEYADRYDVDVVLEPLNRDETHLLTSPSETATLCERIGNGRVKTMVDFYHIDRNGQELVEEIEGAKESLALIHLSNRNRKLPGPVGVNFRSGIECLKRIGYNGLLGFECSGPFTVDELRASNSWVRKLLSGV